MSKLLSIDKIPDEELSTELVEVPEFGYEDDEPLAVIARAMTVSEFNVVVRRSYQMEPSENENEKPKLSLREDFDEASLIASWCSLDDDNNLVFGKNKRAAEMRVAGLSHKYAPAIMRIYTTVLRLSNITRRNDKGESENQTEDERIAEAAKN